MAEQSTTVTEFEEVKESRWNRLKSKLAVHRRRGSDESFAGDDNDQTLANFLKPNAAGEWKRPVPPKLDISAASRWPKVSQVLGVVPQFENREIDTFKYSKPPRRPDLTVGFVAYAPEIIGEGGDDAELPAEAVSRKRPHDRSGSAPLQMPMPPRHSTTDSARLADFSRTRLQGTRDQQTQSGVSEHSNLPHAVPVPVSRRSQPSTSPDQPEQRRRHPIGWEASSSDAAGQFDQSRRVSPPNDASARRVLSGTTPIVYMTPPKPASSSNTDSFRPLENGRQEGMGHETIPTTASKHSGVLADDFRESHQTQALATSEQRLPLTHHNLTGEHYHGQQSLRPPGSGQNSQSGSSRPPSPYSPSEPSNTSQAPCSPPMASPPFNHPSGKCILKVVLHQYNLVSSEGTSLMPIPPAYPHWRRLLVIESPGSELETLNGHRHVTTIVYDTKSHFKDSSISIQRFRLDLRNSTCVSISNSPDTRRRMEQTQGANDVELAGVLQSLEEHARRWETLQTLQFLSRKDMHAFQFAITGFEVRFDETCIWTGARKRLTAKAERPVDARVQILGWKGSTRAIAFLADSRAFGWELKAWDRFEAVEQKEGVSSVKFVNAKVASTETLEQTAGFLSLSMTEITDQIEDFVIGFLGKEARDAFVGALPAPLMSSKGFPLKRHI